MADKRVPRPREAEAVVDERIESFGLGVLPPVTVAALADGSWQVRWDHLERVVAPMDCDAWYAWRQENVGSLEQGDLETTES